MMRLLPSSFVMAIVRRLLGDGDSGDSTDIRRKERPSGCCAGSIYSVKLCLYSLVYSFTIRVDARGGRWAAGFDFIMRLVD